jgi:hypothetical protein
MSLSSSHAGRGDRRRRLLAEQAGGGGRTITSPVTSKGDLPSGHPQGNYGDGAFLDDHPRVIDFVPRKLYGYILLLLAGLGLVVGLLAAAPGYDDWFPAALRARPLRAFALGQPGSLSCWFSTLMLLASAVMALVVYSVRKFKADDYHGHYRVWLWAAFCWILMASDEAASLHDVIAEGLSAATGTRLTGDGSVWWLVPAAFVLGAIASRLLVDVWYCRLATCALVAAILGDVALATMRFHWLPTWGDARDVLLYHGVWMVANLLLLMATALFARHVLLDAEGRLPKREPKAAVQAEQPEASDDADEEDDEEDEDDEDEDDDDYDDEDDDDDEEDEDEDEDEEADTSSKKQWQQVHTSHPASQPILKRVAASKPVATAATPASAAGNSAGKLSKAERKALRDRLLKEKAERARKSANW